MGALRRQEYSPLSATPEKIGVERDAEALDVFGILDEKTGRPAPPHFA